MSKTVVIEGLEYTASNHRMRYNPEFHFNQGKPWTMKDILYLCGMWGGRTESTCMTKVYELRKNGKFEEYRRMFNK